MVNNNNLILKKMYDLTVRLTVLTSNEINNETIE